MKEILTASVLGIIFSVIIIYYWKKQYSKKASKISLVQEISSDLFRIRKYIEKIDDFYLYEIECYETGTMLTVSRTKKIKSRKKLH